MNNVKILKMTTIVNLDTTNIPGIVIYNTIVVSNSRCMHTTNQRIYIYIYIICNIITIGM